MIKEIVTSAAPIGARTIRKMQIRILPFIFLLYVVAYLDRINIGFAALTMNKELAITSRQFGLIAGIFFFGYFLFEVPSNLLLHKIGARIWIARILITWGIIAMLTGRVLSKPKQTLPTLSPTRMTSTTGSAMRAVTAS